MNESLVPATRAKIYFAPCGRLFRWLLLLILLCVATQHVWAQDISGSSLEIDGDSLMWGHLQVDSLNVLSGGEVDDGFSTDTLYLQDPGDYGNIFSMVVHEGDNDPEYLQPMEVDFNAFGYNNAQWNWSNSTGTQMFLDQTSVLSLFSTGGNLVIDPGNQSLFFNDNLAINEGNSTFTMSGNAGNIAFDPNGQTIHFSSGLTLNGNTGNLTIFAGSNGFAVGTNATATGTQSAAFGGNASASNSFSVALANGTASGIGSVGIADGAASGNWSVALIGGTTGGNGTAGLAIGSSAFANSTGAIALGNGTTAEAWSSVTVGHYNANITGNNTTLVATDPVFIVGVGGNNTTRANGLVILNNGNTTVGGNLSVSGNVTGNVTMTGNVNVSLPQGDIPMGAYGGD